MGYIATALLSWAVAGDIVSIVPFALLFGLQPLVMGLTAKLGKRWYFIIPIKLVHFNLGLWGTVSLFGGWGTSITLYLSRLGWEANYWALAIVLSVLWIAFDWAMGWAQRWLARRLNKVIGKYAPAAGVQSNAPGDKQKDIFVVGDNPIQENNPSKGDNSIQEDDSTQDEPSDQE